MKRIVFALFLILIVTIINFYGDNIYYDYKIYKFRENYNGVNYNKYMKDEEFVFVKKNENIELNNKDDIINSIYTLLNSGDTVLKRYCSKNYKTCKEDINSIANDEDLLSII